MTLKKEGRTQLVGYAMKHMLVAKVSLARTMDLETLRALVEAHRVRAETNKDTREDLRALVEAHRLRTAS